MADMYMRNIRDWRDATLMLSFEEKGYFDELLSLIYIYDNHLPDNDDLICRAMPINKKRHLRLKQKLIKAGLIVIKDGFYFNKRAAQEIAKINEISDRNKVKAKNRWAKSLKNKGSADTAAAAITSDECSAAGAVINPGADTGAMQKVKCESEYESHEKTGQKGKNNAKPNRKRSSKCTIDQVIDPDGEIPEDYRRFAESQGLKNPQRRFEDWAGWWLGENGQKAGARGWFQTWKARVRKDVDRQLAGASDCQRQKRRSACTTTEGARLALDRRRARSREIR